jgi:GNAT superfamily N-acetyltransferase
MVEVHPTIRRAQLSDSAALASLMRHSVHTLCARDYNEAQIAAVAEAFGFGTLDEQLIRDETYFVAEWNGVAVGCGGWTRRVKAYAVQHDRTARRLVLPHPTPGRAAIRAIFVHPDMAGRGVGRLLVRAAEGAARKWGYDVFEIAATLTGAPLYRKLAYRMHGIYSFDLHGNGRFPFALMSKADPDREVFYTSDTCAGAVSRPSRHTNVVLM